MTRPVSDSDFLRSVYEACALELAQLVGDPDMGVQPSVDTDQLPATVITAGRQAFRYLAVAVGILDTDGPTVGITPEQALAAFTAEQERS